MKKIVIVIIFVFAFIVLFYCFNYVELLPGIKAYGKMELERFNQMIVTHSYMTNESVYERFINIERNETGEISLVEFDMIQISQLANDIVVDIESTYAAIENHNYTKKDDSYYEKRIYEVSKNGIISKISLSSLMNMPYLYKMLPSVSVRYKHLTKVNSSIIKKVENYGINHIMIEIVIKVTMNHTIIYPFLEEMQEHSIDIPILLEIYQGQIPLVYNSQ